MRRQDFHETDPLKSCRCHGSSNHQQDLSFNNILQQPKTGSL